MNGARFVHDQLELLGWDVVIADALKVKGLAPLAAKTDRIDAWVLAELGRRDLVPAIWLPDPANRAERERARFRLHLVRHRTALKNRIHATLIAFGHPVPVSDLFGAKGRGLLAGLAIPEPWATTRDEGGAVCTTMERPPRVGDPRRLGGSQLGDGHAGHVGERAPVRGPCRKPLEGRGRWSGSDSGPSWTARQGHPDVDSGSSTASSAP